jgi:hypothetical protein
VTPVWVGKVRTLSDDLTASHRAAMVGFVEEKLLAGVWMRALAADDPAAASADRPDHGARGAFGAWPGVTAHGLARLGRPDLAARVLSVAHEAASGGLWGQAMEVMSGERGLWARVAQDGASNRDAIAGVGIAEAVVSGLFGFDATFRSPGSQRPGTIEVPGVGLLRNLNVGPA